MRFSLSTLFVLTSLALGSSPASAVAGQSELPTTTLTRRQTTVTGGVCAQTPLVVTGVSVLGAAALTATLNTICLCVDVNGALTGDSQSALDAAVRVQGLQGVLGTLGINADAAITRLLNGSGGRLGVAALVNQQKAACNYPANSTPICGATCDFTCPAGTTKVGTPGTTSAACMTNASGARKRAQFAMNQPGACAFGKTACSVIGISGRRTSQFECLDVKTNLQACGGCPHPLRNKPAGDDCTLIDNVESVSCVDGGCKVDSCIRGFAVSAEGNSCVAVRASRK